MVVKNQGPLLKEGHPLKELETVHQEPKLLIQNKLAYLAGVFDGEGSFGHWSKGQKNNYKEVVVQVEMRDIDIIGKFQEFFACGHISYRAPRTENANPTHVWKVKGDKALEVLKLMLPFFGERRREKYNHVVESIRVSGKNGSKNL